MRVLHAVNNLHAGGLERLVVDLVRRTDPDRFESHVIALQHLGRGAAELEGVAQVHLGVRGRRGALIRPQALAAQVKRIAPDVVHTHSGVWYKMTRAARMAGVPRLIHTDHGRLLKESWLHRFLDRRASRRTDVIVAVSEQLRRDLTREIVAFPERVQVILNGVDTGRFAPREDGCLRQELGGGRGPMLGTIGRLDPIKGYDSMIRALAQVRAGWKGGAPPVLVIAGEGPEENSLRALARELDLGDAVRFLGWRSDVAPLYSAFTVFTLSSVSEGTSISLLEAMSCGVCPVVTDVGGNRAVLGPGLAHRLVAPGDPGALATAWLDALTDDGRRTADARAARARVLDSFDVEEMVRRYQTLYLEDGPALS